MMRILPAIFLLLCGARAAAPRDGRPNIVVILSDDMGYSDLGCMGGEIRTPALDALAAGGLRFTQFYNTGRCCPTRAALLTGLYPHQAGVGHMMEDRGADGYRGNLNRRCVTIAEALRPAGYGTFMAGKWHVTKEVQGRTDEEKHNWPLQRGFDRFYGTIQGGGSFYDPVSLTRDNRFVAPEKPESFYYTDALSDAAAEFIGGHDVSKPFLVYLAYTAAHWPMHAREEDVAKVRGSYDKGWDPVREARYRRMTESGLIDRKWKLAPHARAWEEVAEKDRPWFARRMEVYAAMVEVMDRGIGRVVEALRKKGALENTLVLFLQDNGGCAEETGSRGPVKPAGPPGEPRPMAPGELQKRMIPEVTRDGRPVRQGHGVMAGPADTFTAYGQEWANASNTPFRLYKHWVHEGGISTPLIAHWPRGIARRGEFERQPGHLVDLMATFLDLAKAPYPAERDGQKVWPLEGVSLAPAFVGRDLGRKAPIFWEHERNRAVREGKWKLAARAGGPWELYDMEADRSEMDDLAAAQPDRVKEMSAAWDAWAERAWVTPFPKK